MSEQKRWLFDFFISYKQRDAGAFVEALAAGLRLNGHDIWLDSDQIHPGDSILKSIENGISDSIDSILVLTKNYFEGWSEYERQAIYSLMVNQKTRIIPIWYQLTHSDVARMAPMLASINAIKVDSADGIEIDVICKKISNSYGLDQRRSRLYELFFRCILKNFPEDNDVRMFLAVMDNDIDALNFALEKGANPNITDSEIWNRYSRSAFDCCFPEWRRLFLFFHKTK